MRLTKHHGLGNDFLVALSDANETLVPDPDTARALCDAGELTVETDAGACHLVTTAAVDPGVDGAPIEAMVPGGINVHFLVSEGDGIRLTHWERGAGVTRACGSGASVAAEAARRWGLATDQVEVAMPGGNAIVHLGPVVRLTGPATFVGEVTTP